jgi:hypothetical protein
MNIKAEINLLPGPDRIILWVKSPKGGHSGSIVLQDISNEVTRLAGNCAGVLLATFLSLAVITMDCLTHGGLFKTDWWQWLRQFWI